MEPLAGDPRSDRIQQQRCCCLAKIILIDHAQEKQLDKGTGYTLESDVAVRAVFLMQP
jgi:hypothetical protein